jgi:hypothetical protein
MEEHAWYPSVPRRRVDRATRLGLNESRPERAALHGSESDRGKQTRMAKLQVVASTSWTTIPRRELVRRRRTTALLFLRAAGRTCVGSRPRQRTAGTTGRIYLSNPPTGLDAYSQNALELPHRVMPLLSPGTRSCRVMRCFEPAFAGGSLPRNAALAQAYRVISLGIRDPYNTCWPKTEGATSRLKCSWSLALSQACRLSGVVPESLRGRIRPS